MDSKAKALGHPIHQVLIVFPLGLLVTAVIFDIIHLFTGGRDFSLAAAYVMAAGLIGGVIAGIFGLVDWLAIPAGSRAKRIGALHGLGNVVVLLLFLGSWLLRANSVDWVPGALALVLSFAGVVLGGVTGWLGGELVDRLGVGVHEGANVDAPSSLSHRRAA
ncbi:DUF2231 domain-containing protein [Herbidospora cretacea]|uniref:DUF2231 domain-containing protein n=1 Tax=Herbidospora cretacea TaxID=28444 RepID=UPI0004C40C2F|nr:DUF2231 domain-containing protein [Herbidospora cretacea]